MTTVKIKYKVIVVEISIPSHLKLKICFGLIIILIPIPSKIIETPLCNNQNLFLIASKIKYRLLNPKIAEIFEAKTK